MIIKKFLYETCKRLAEAKLLVRLHVVQNLYFHLHVVQNQYISMHVEQNLYFPLHVVRNLYTPLQVVQIYISHLLCKAIMFSGMLCKICIVLCMLLKTDCSKYLLNRSFRLWLQVSNKFGSTDSGSATLLLTKQKTKSIQ